MKGCTDKKFLTDIYEVMLQKAEKIRMVFVY